MIPKRPERPSLDELMMRQAEFDNNHHNHGHSDRWGEKVGDDLQAIEHSVVCLIGEVGEFANILKKVVRGDRSAEEARPQLEEELADAFIYLVQIANRLNINLSDAFLQKLELNWKRFVEFEP